MSTYLNEQGYYALIQDVLKKGIDIPDRTGVGCRALFDAKVVFDTGIVFPFSTLRPAPLRMAFEELWFFLRGDTQTKYLEEKGIYFWQPQTSREFLDGRGLTDLPEGSLGRAYSAQFRDVGGKVDQLRQLYYGLKNDPYGRRHVFTLWNVSELPEMPLTPCWMGHQFVVLPDQEGNNVLHLKLINRSLDCVFGFLFAIQQYALYQTAMAKLLGMEVGKLSCDLTHVHIYQNQIEYAKECLTREFGKPGEVKINKELNTLEDLINLQWEDIKVEGLEVNKTPFKTVRPPMSV